MIPGKESGYEFFRVVEKADAGYAIQLAGEGYSYDGSKADFAGDSGTGG